MTPAGFLALLVAAGPAGPTDELIRSVESASQAALESPTDVRGEGELRMALDAVRKSPLQTAQSRRLRRSRIDGLLSLAAVYLARGDTEKAWDAVDEALRASGDTLGDSEGTLAVQDLISRWRAKNLPVGRVEFRCWDGCTVLLHGRVAGRGQRFVLDRLPLGEYSMVVLSEGRILEQRPLELTAGAPRDPLVFGVPPKPPPPPAYRAKIPRWVSITGVALGTSLLVAGGVLSLIDDRCYAGLEDRDDVSLDCRRTFDTTAEGLGLLTSSPSNFLFSSFERSAAARGPRHGATNEYERTVPCTDPRSGIRLCPFGKG